MFTAAEALVAPRGSNPGAITLLAAPSPPDYPSALARTWAPLPPTPVGLDAAQAVLEGAR